MKIRYTPEARADLRAIREYLRSFLGDHEKAAAQTKAILDECAMLKRFRKMGVVLAARLGVDTDLKMLVCGKYIALYRLEKDYVSVARIIDARQDYLRVLLGDDYMERGEDG